ncbi:DUF1513 domain-containing protein [Mangrovicoccus algicola]|uniref:DUF1513 domain-containing protein n=1 Tax=Mangrovicoccus algicola TaxID=2771008 RepID=A0A8J6YYU9_9RHOB|nr:DUF1513 domain-containing protein [Mangrovicoccus algicola]MBE3640517.1 DUF1513 domain-containing protein [Mangrovicoccus algicola]
MASRRDFLAGLLAAGAVPRPGWAEAGAPDFLAAGRRGSGDYVLCGLRASGDLAFEVALPGRGHAGAGHPERPEAVAFARRPGTFALVIDCRTGAVLARLETPPGRHFMGHGTFSAEGRLLYTPENAFDEGQGRIGIWDASAGYRRIGEFWSGGIGPHEALFLPGSDVMAIANGGIDTHPDSGRTKLNLPVMRPALVYASAAGEILETVDLPPEWHLNSIRHLAVRSDGLVAAAMQWEGDVAAAPPLLMLHRRGQVPSFPAFDPAGHRAMQGYAGSVALSGDGRIVAISSPRGALVQSFETATGRPLAAVAQADVCGLAPAGEGLLLTSGTGRIARFSGAGAETLAEQPVAWDNHVVALNRAGSRPG